MPLATASAIAEIATVLFAAPLVLSDSASAPIASLNKPSTRAPSALKPTALFESPSPLEKSA